MRRSDAVVSFPARKAVCYRGLFWRMFGSLYRVEFRTGGAYLVELERGLALAVSSEEICPLYSRSAGYTLSGFQDYHPVTRQIRVFPQWIPLMGKVVCELWKLEASSQLYTFGKISVRVEPSGVIAIREGVLARILPSNGDECMLFNGLDNRRNADYGVRTMRINQKDKHIEYKMYSCFKSLS